MKEHSEPSKEEAKLQSEQKTAEEIIEQYFIKKLATGNPMHMASVKYFVETGKATGGLRLALNEMIAAASQFKSQLPIEQKNELELIIAEKNIDIIHLRDRIKELESQPLPIEGVEREQLREAFEAGQHADDYDQWVKHNYDFDEWLATRKGSISGE